MDYNVVALDCKDDFLNYIFISKFCFIECPESLSVNLIEILLSD